VAVDAAGGVGHELADGVDAVREDAGALVEVDGGNDGVGYGFGGDGAFVAVAKGIAEWMASGREADVVNPPTIDGYGGDSFRGGGCGFAEAGFEAGEDGG
jgi:hypothetical protein